MSLLRSEVCVRLLCSIPGVVTIVYFAGIITALREFQPKLVEHNISIFVRRAGPNYQEGLRKMREIGSSLGIPLFVFGPETHMTAICGMALGKRPIPQCCNVDFATANFLLPGGQQQQETTKGASETNGSTGKITNTFFVIFFCVLRVAFQYFYFMVIVSHSFVFHDQSYFIRSYFGFGLITSRD